MDRNEELNAFQVFNFDNLVALKEIFVQTDSQKNVFIFGNELCDDISCASNLERQLVLGT